MNKKKKRIYYLGKYSRKYDDLLGPRHVLLNAFQPKNVLIKPLKFVSYNIKYGKNIHHAVELIETSATLKNADVMCLQEMNLNGVCEIAKMLKYNYVYYPAARHKFCGDDLGNAILSKWPMTDDQKIILPHPISPTSRRIAVAATVNVADNPIRVFSVHKEVIMHKDQRSMQVESIISSIPQGIQRCVVAGDFNTFRKSTVKTIQDVFDRNGFIHATKNAGWTYKHWYLLNKKSTLDHIFIKGLDLVDCGKVFDQKVSDHFPLWADLH